MYRMLARYLEFCEGILELLKKKAAGLGAEAKDGYYDFIKEFGKYELEMELCYDHRSEFIAYRDLFGKEDTVIII